MFLRRIASPTLAFFALFGIVLIGCGGGGGGTPINPGPAATTTTLSVAPNTNVTTTTPVALTATVTSSGGTPTGTVTFFDGTTSLGTKTLSSGAATLNLSTLTAGSHSFTASYSGTTGFSTSTSSAVALTVTGPPATTTTTLSIAPDTNVTTTTPVTLTATVTSSGATPTGTVTFLDGMTTIGTGTLNSGIATLQLSTLAAGTHSFTASYGGDSGSAASVSTAIALTVTAPIAATTTALTVAPNTGVTTTTPVALTATVTSSGGTPTGTVTFFDGTTNLGTANLVSGAATLNLSSLAAGSHSLTASYAGDSSYAASTSAATALTVTTATTTTALTVAPNTGVTITTPVALTATVTSSSGTPTGTVTFFDGTTSLGTKTLSSGTATLNLSSLAAGSHSLTASYAGDSSFAASTSSAAALTVTTATTTTALAIAPDTNVTDTTPVALTATVTSSGGTPTGTVTFFDGTTSLGTANLVSGTATLNLSSLAAGSHSLTASYAGDSSYAASTSSALALTVTGASAINAHATFSFSTPNQTISGFGAAEAFYANWLDSLPASSQTAIYTALFDPTQGLGLTYLRVQDLYRGNPTGFDPDTPKVVSAANAAHGSPLTLLMSSWSPPADEKSNGTTTGGGTLIQKSGAYDYPGFAQYWYDSLTAYAALGVSPDYISIQNEPDWTASYDSCLFSATEGPYASYSKAFDAVYNAINGGSLTKIPQMIGPETLSAGSSFLSLAATIPTSEVAAYAHHLYNVSSTNPNPDSGLTALQGVESAYPAQLKFMTEYYDAPGFLTAWNIHNALTVADDNAYIFWGATWPSTLDAAKDQASDQQGLIYIDNPFNPSSTWAFPQGWTYNDAYYAMKHYSYYIKPGYIRYDATVDNSDERVSVYQSPDQKTTVIVALNVSTTATDVLALDLSSITYTNSTLIRSTFSQPISTGERWDNLGTYDAATGITLAPQSAVTIVLTN